uniref:Uncharacterized protein n=1 Tax=Panagrolaimus davidi TaxID=227884 RepID=A0A914PDX8_9BILA
MSLIDLLKKYKTTEVSFKEEDTRKNIGNNLIKAGQIDVSWYGPFQLDHMTRNNLKCAVGDQAHFKGPYSKAYRMGTVIHRHHSSDIVVKTKPYGTTLFVSAFLITKCETPVPPVPPQRPTEQHMNCQENYESYICTPKI